MRSKRALVIALALAVVTAGAVWIAASFDEPVQPATEPTATSQGRQVPSASTPDDPGGRLPVIDVHVHLSPGAEERLYALMEKYGFDHVVNLSGGNPLGGLKKQLAISRSSRGRITTFTTLAYELVRHPEYGQQMALALRIAHQMGAKGLKIAKALGLGLPGPDGKLLPVDDPKLDPVFETAGELDMPVAIHSGDPKAFWQPVDKKNERYAELSAHPGWALHGEDVPSFDAILAQLERRIARHPKTRFISVHFGNCAEDLDYVARLLRKYPNLYIDTAARIPEIGRHPPDRVRAFFIEFQDRILYGSDLGVGPEPSPLFLGSSGADPPTPKDETRFFAATKRFFETSDENFDHPTPIQGDWKISGINLPRPVLRKIYADNAKKLLRIELE